MNISDPDDAETPQSAESFPIQLAQSLLAIALAMRPQTRKARLEFDRRIRRVLRSTPPADTLARTILRQTLKR